MNSEDNELTEIISWHDPRVQAILSKGLEDPADHDPEEFVETQRICVDGARFRKVLASLSNEEDDPELTERISIHDPRVQAAIQGFSANVDPLAMTVQKSIPKAVLRVPVQSEAPTETRVALPAPRAVPHPELPVKPRALRPPTFMPLNYGQELNATTSMEIQVAPASVKSARRRSISFLGMLTSAAISLLAVTTFAVVLFS